MLINVKKLIGYKIQAQDGEIGTVDDLYFDAQDWVLRYLVVDTGPWILGRKVLLTHHALHNTDWNADIIHVSLTREQVEDSPEMDSLEGVTRPQETSLYEYYGWPVYWNVPAMQAGIGPTPPVLPPAPVPPVRETPDTAPLNEEDANLHRFSKVKGYKVEAKDGTLGHIEDFVIEDQTWTINYFIVDTGGWFSKGHHVMLAPHWIVFINEEDGTVTVDLTKETIRSSPEFEADRIIENN